ncbi:MAG: hypothetical protein ACHQ2Y_10460, partial [Candidatus Lutacidiplasmatales archaeon]
MTGVAGRALFGTGVGLFAFFLVLAPSLAPGDSHHGLPAQTINRVVAQATPAVAVAPQNKSIQGPSLGISADPGSICAFQTLSCPAGVSVSRVTMWSDAASAAQVTWPKVQVAFVVETDPIDGVYNPTEYKAPYTCTAAKGIPAGLPCEESDGVPVFIVKATQIAEQIQAENPHSQVTFALIDYYGTNDQWDTDGGGVFHLDIGTFVPANELQTDVVATFQANVLSGGFTYWYSGWQDNFLHSSSITALYGTLTGASGLQWTPDTHHVVIWMGSTAPRDPSYVENYCVSPSFVIMWGFYSGCTAGTCEPSYVFTSGTSPLCEGWIHSQDGNTSHSIAALAHTSPDCTDAVGHSCTIDIIDLVNTATDPYSPDWPKKCPAGVTGCGPGGTTVVQDVIHILQAGCDLAVATGGSWNGPTWFTCKNGQQGSIQYVQHGPADTPNTNDPTLMAAFRTVSFGPIAATQVAGGTSQPMFVFMPHGAIQPAPGAELQPTAACQRGFILLRDCQVLPTIAHIGGIEYLAWNWSTNATRNVMYIGDQWTATFNVIATGPPFARVPVDACITFDCKVAGSNQVDGVYSWDTFVPYTNNTVLTESFPVAQINVETTPL